MGFYDTTCLITGTSLSYIEATAVLLRRTASGGYHPVSLGIQGAYDGYGCLEFVETDHGIAALTAFFSHALETGRFRAQDTTRIGEPRWTDADIETLLYLIERTTTGSELYGGLWQPSTLLDGDPVVMAMIAQSVWDAITAEHPGPSDLIVEAFGSGHDLAMEIYGADLHGRLREPLRELAAMSTFIAAHPPLRWAPPGEREQRFFRDVGHQFSDEDRRNFLAVARNEYRENHRLQRALSAVASATLD